MTFARVVALALLVFAGLVTRARAQASWPAQEIPRPSEASHAHAPQAQAPLARAPQGCVVQYTAMRSEVEKAGTAAKAGGEKLVSRARMCKLVAG
jgi:hypothetical protein